MLAAPIALLLAATAALAVTGRGPFDGDAQERPPVRAAAAPARPTTDRFDVGRAMRTAKFQVDAGPRPAGSATLRRVSRTLRAALPSGRYEPVPGHPGLRNIVGSIPGPGPVLVIASHIDTLEHPRGHLGANNAAAGVGAVIELARYARTMPRPAAARGIRFVLFDGEQSPSTDESRFYELGLRGSKAYVRAHAEEVESMVLLDYIGNKDLDLPREGASDPVLWARMRAAARRVGTIRHFPDRVGLSILDDTTPFTQAGIPAVDVIDWDDPNRHKLSDTYDQLSARSVDVVGETVAQLMVDRDRAIAAGRGFP